VEPPSFEELYRGYFAFSWRALLALGVPAAGIEDAAQEVWVVVHRRLPDFEGRSALKTWLFGIAVNVARNARRSERRRAKVSPLRDELVSMAPDPASASEDREAWRLVAVFLATLDEQRREVFVCSVLEGMSAPEAAEATGLDVATVNNRIRSLRRSFKTWLEQRKEAP